MSRVWEVRAATGQPCWTGDLWIDWEHAQALSRALPKVWPGGVRRFIDVGSGDGWWTRWMMERFDAHGYGLDPFAPAAVRVNTIREDAKVALPRLKHELQLDLIVFVNSLNCIDHWKDAVWSATALGLPILVADNTQTPTPEWYRNLPHRVHIPFEELLSTFGQWGYQAERSVATDVLYRRWLEHAPGLSRPLVAAASAAVDVAVQGRLSPWRARHTATLFRPDGS